MRWLGHVLWNSVERLQHKILASIPERRCPIGRPKLSEERMVLQYTEAAEVGKDRDIWRHLYKAIGR